MITFVGNGAGATATSAIGENGIVTDINLVSGGSGYRPNPYTMLSIAVIVSTGYVENIKYR